MNTNTTQRISSLAVFSVALIAAACNQPLPTEPRYGADEVQSGNENSPAPLVQQASMPIAEVSRDATVTVTASPNDGVSIAPPTDLAGLVREARQMMDSGDYKGALESSERALTLDIGSPKALHVHGRALLALNRTPEAIETLSLAHETDPDNGYIANTLGYALLISGKPSEAVGYLENARELLSNVAYVRNNLGVAYERLDRTDEAIAEYQAAVAAGDSDGKAAMSLSRLGIK